MALQISEAELERIVRSVLSELTGNGQVKAAGRRVVNGQGGTVDEAVDAAAVAFEQLSACSLDDRKRFIEAIRTTGLKNNKLPPKMPHHETHIARSEPTISK